MTNCDILKKRKGAAYRILCGILAFTFFFSWILPPGYAQLIPQNVLNLPAPGTMVSVSPAFTPALINGITIHPENPLEFDFIVGTGDEKLQGKAFEEESTKLIKYFLASLTVPEDEMWVNLSPYEKDRIIPTGFGTTEMGRDLLAQDYILKQLTASLMYPEKELGKKFWDKIYRKAREQYGTAEIPVNTFNKVWIVPQKAVVYEHGNSAFVVKSRLKVMLESDYEAMNDSRKSSVVSRKQGSLTTYDLPLTTQIVKEIILPAIEQEVNEGKSFANLRQIYNSAILAAWFKQNLRQTLLGQVYVDKTKTKGVDVEDKTVNEKIYAQYLEAFRKGVYNYIKEDVDPATQEMIPRKYFSGGTNLKVGDLVETYRKGMSLTMPQQEIVGEYLAGLKEYNQGMVRVNLVELSEEMSVADAQEAIASSQQAAKKSSSPVTIDILAYETGGSVLAGAKMEILSGLVKRYGSTSAAENSINEAESIANGELVSLAHSTAGSGKVARGTASAEDKQAYFQSRMGGEWAKFLPAGGDATRLGVSEQKILLDLKGLFSDEREEELEAAMRKALLKRQITEEQIAEIRELKESLRDELLNKTIIARILESEAGMFGGNKEALLRQTYILAPSAGHEQELADELARVRNEEKYFGFGREAFFILPQEQEPKYRQDGGTIVVIDKKKAGGNGVPIINMVLEGKGYTIGEGGELVEYAGTAVQYAEQRGAKYIYQGTIGDLRPWTGDPSNEEFAGRIFKDLSFGNIAAAAEYVKQNPKSIQKGGTVFYNEAKGVLEFVEKLAMGHMLDKVDFEQQPLASFNHIFDIKALESIKEQRMPLYVRAEDGEFFTELVGGDILNILQRNGHEVAHVERPVQIHELKGTASLATTIRAAFVQDTGRKYLEEKPLTAVSLRKWIRGATPSDKALPALIALDKETNTKNLSADTVFSLVALYRYFDLALVGTMLHHEEDWNFDIADDIFKRFKDILTGHPELIDEIKERMAGRQTAGKPLSAVSLQKWIKGAASTDKALPALIALNKETDTGNLSADAVFSLVALYRYFDPGLVGTMLDHEGTWDLDTADKILKRFKDILTDHPELMNEISARAASSPVGMTPLSVEALRSPASVADGLAWKERNEYIFGGGFGYDLRINNAETEWQAIAKFMYAIGRTLGGGKYLKNRGTALVTGDQRGTSDAFRLALAQGLADEGIGVATQNAGDVITTGLTSRKGLADNFGLVIQITGSHNPKQSNGVKISSYKGLPFFGRALVELSAAVETQQGWSPETRQEGIVVSADFISEHIEALNKALPDLQNPPSLAADFRRGAAGKVFMGLAEKKGYEVIKLYSPEAALPDDVFRTEGKPVLIVLNDTPSAGMEAGIWDPSQPEAFDGIRRLQERIYGDARFSGRRFAGVVFDGDGDRAGMMDETGRLVMPERMLMAYYQRMILANEEGIRALNELGHTVKLALDVRASRVIIDVLKNIALQKNLKIEGEFIAAGFPNHRTFVMEELGKIQQLLDSHPSLAAEKIAAVKKLMLEYTSAEASGHFFFNVLSPEKFLQKKSVVDDGITSSFLFLHLVGTMNDYEFKGPREKLSPEELTVGKADELFEVLPVTNEIRLSDAPSDVAKKQALAEEIMRGFARHHPDLIPMPLEQFYRKIEEARNNPPRRQSWDDPLLLVDGIRVELTNGVWILLRKSNTSAVIVFKAEADSDEKKVELERTMRFLDEAMREAVASNPDFAGLKLKDYEKEIDRVASSPLENIPQAMTALAGRDLKGVRVLIRANLNVPMTSGYIQDTTRLKELDPIIKFLLARKADIILLGHNGRLEDGKDSRKSFRPLLEYFQLRFPRVPATLYEKSITAEGLQFKAEKLITHKYDEGSIHILQNVRFADKSENGKPGSPQRDAFGRGLAGLTKGDNGKTGILIVDAFGDIGSKGASVEDLPRHFTAMGGEVYAGPSMVKEFENFGQVLKQGIDVIIFGGVKSDKIEPLVRIVNHSLSSDGQIFLGSAPSAALAMGHPLLKNLMADNPGRVLTTVDYSNPQNTFDIGLQTRQLFLQKLDALRAGQTVLLNGTMGYVEEPSGQYKEGTKVIIEKLKELAGRGVRIIILGGDGGSNARQYGLDKMENVSLITGGGVPLKILAGEELVGIKALQNAVSPAPVEEEISFPVDDEDAEPVAVDLESMAFLAPGRKVAVVLEGYWQTGRISRVSLQEIIKRTGLNKEFVLAAINGINGNFNSPFTVEAAGLNKKLDNETLWIQLVARRPLGESRPPSQGLQPRVRPASSGAGPRPQPYGSGRASSPIEGLEVALVGGMKGDVADNMRLIGQLLASNESSKVLVGGVTALALLEARKMIGSGASGVDKGVVEDARSYMNHYRVILPSQVEVMDPENPASREVIRVGIGKKVPPGKVIVGFGKETISRYADTISGSRLTFWSGPMDVDGTPQKIIEALAQAQRRGPLFVGEGSAGAAKAADLTGSVYFSNNDLSKFLDDKAMKGGRGVTVSRQVKDRVPPEEVGGINLNPALLDLQIKRDGNGVPLPLPQQPLERMNIEGFIPVIINITPVTNLPLLLGLADTRQGEDETIPAMKAREPEEISALN